ncbi:MAG TPA: hypothetical protein VGI77_05385 [Gaiellaceae bacterium]|jgi:hypothetical protein
MARSREFQYEVELTTGSGRPRSFRYVVLQRLPDGPQLLRYHSDWFVVETIEHPKAATSLGTIAGVEVADLMRNDMREIIATGEHWDEAARSLARDRTRSLRGHFVRWLLVLRDPPLLRMVRDDGTALQEIPLQTDVDQPVYQALLEVSLTAGR